METASLRFLAFGVVVAIGYNLRRPVGWRQGVLLVANLCFLLTFAAKPWMLLPFVGFLLVGYGGVRLMQSGQFPKAFAPLVLTTIALFIWLKRYTFLPHASFLRTAYVTIGLSYIFFRVLHLIVDGKDGELPHRLEFVSYLNYTLNFTTLVSGPIQLYQDFAKTHLAPERPPLTIFTIGRAAERIAIGYFKVEVLSMMFSSLQTHAIAALSSSQPLPWRIFTGAVIAAVYPVYLYCNFSGYIDFVIGIAALMRFTLPENFNRPFSSDNFLNFWSRWHITLSNWFKVYFYNPLLMALMRRFTSPAVEPFLAVIAFFMTFFLLGIWHGRTSVFAFYGVVLAFGVSVNKLYQILMVKKLGRKAYKALSEQVIYNACTRGLTYTYYSFCMLWFWSNWLQMAGFLRQLEAPALAGMWLLIFIAATVILSVWEALRAWLLDLKWTGTPLLESRYARTVYVTVAVVMTAAVIKLVNAPPPQIVYKGF
jgi:D-alanyl-lipoteichoic acid acyltransferase DltB (MBOAT superfamily)